MRPAPGFGEKSMDSDRHKKVDTVQTLNLRDFVTVGTFSDSRFFFLQNLTFLLDFRQGPGPSSVLANRSFSMHLSLVGPNFFSGIKILFCGIFVLLFYFTHSASFYQHGKVKTSFVRTDMESPLRCPRALALMM